MGSYLKQTTRAKLTIGNQTPKHEAGMKEQLKEKYRISYTINLASVIIIFDSER
jgi:hypothetical protein